VSAKGARKVWWAVRIGRPLIGLLARTWRVVEENAEPFRALTDEGRPYLLCAWHGELLAGLWANRHRGFSAMVSEHSDGEIITQVMAGWGFRAVRGSTSRGAMGALRGMLREITEGRGFALTPDGPRGPAGVAQMGVLLASSRARTPIAPMRIYAERAWRMKSWDRFMIPKPFSRIRVVYGEPWVAPGADEDSARELERRLGPAS
jgi:lysophospholipid acyltransferase (LPLAT)-like uncharacterized protein